jgi:DNA-binding response OmpR family regulator
MLVVVSEQFSDLSAIADRLTDRGIFLLHCPIETAEFVCNKYDTGGVLLDLTSRAREGVALFERLRRIYPAMPIGVICDKNRFPWIPFDAVIRRSDDEEIERGILAFCLRRCRFYVGAVSGREFCLMRRAFYYRGRLFSLSPRQHRVLRCLAYRSPRTVERGDLLSMCFPTELVTPSELAVLIHSINKRLVQNGLEPLIVNVYGKGYRLLDGVLD